MFLFQTGYHEAMHGIHIVGVVAGASVLHPQAFSKGVNVFGPRPEVRNIMSSIVVENPESQSFFRTHSLYVLILLFYFDSGNALYYSCHSTDYMFPLSSLAYNKHLEHEKGLSASMHEPTKISLPPTVLPSFMTKTTPIASHQPGTSCLQHREPKRRTSPNDLKALLLVKEAVLDADHGSAQAANLAKELPRLVKEHSPDDKKATTTMGEIAKDLWTRELCE